MSYTFGLVAGETAPSTALTGEVPEVIPRSAAQAGNLLGSPTVLAISWAVAAGVASPLELQREWASSHCHSTRFEGTHTLATDALIVAGGCAVAVVLSVPPSSNTMPNDTEHLRPLA
jgi:hypothetical protein